MRLQAAQSGILLRQHRTLRTQLAGLLRVSKAQNRPMSNILLSLVSVAHTLEVLLRRMKISKLPAVHVLGSAFLSVAFPNAAFERNDRCCRERAATASL